VSIRDGLVVATALAMATACRTHPGAGAPAPGPSASPVVEAPRPLDTSWQRDPWRLLSPGEPAPDFDGIAHTGMRVRLSAFLGKPVIVCFYADDRSAEAAPLARAFRDAWLRLSDKIGMVLAVSPGDRTLHGDFASAEALPFLLVSDEKSEIARAFGVPLDGGRPRQTTFVVGKDGKVARVFPEPAADGHVTEVVEAVTALR
jgi:peroxiredoxin Q/BCP